MTLERGSLTQAPHETDLDDLRARYLEVARTIRSHYDNNTVPPPQVEELEKVLRRECVGLSQGR